MAVPHFFNYEVMMFETNKPPKLPKPATEYAKVVWTAYDIKTLRPRWSLKRCEEFLAENEHHLRDRLIELGWEVLSCLMPIK